MSGDLPSMGDHCEEATPERQSETSGASSLHGLKGRVLIVDDEVAVCSVIQRLVILLGHEGVCAVNSEAALHNMESKPGFDCALIDVTLRGRMSGFKLAKLVQERFPDTSTIMMSGYPVGHLEPQYKIEECNNFLQKPFNKSELEAVLRGVPGLTEPQRTRLP